MFKRRPFPKRALRAGASSRMACSTSSRRLCWSGARMHSSATANKSFPVKHLVGSFSRQAPSTFTTGRSSTRFFAFTKCGRERRMTRPMTWLSSRQPRSLRPSGAPSRSLLGGASFPPAIVGARPARRCRPLPRRCGAASLAPAFSPSVSCSTPLLTLLRVR